MNMVDGQRRNSTLICTPLMAETVDQMVVQMKKAKEAGADVVEIRLDYLKLFSPKQDLDYLIRQSPLPTLVTFRMPREVSSLSWPKPMPAIKNFVRLNQVKSWTLLPVTPKWEGGEYDGDESKRQEALRLAMELGADYVDVELQVAPGFINSICGKKNDNVKIIVSSHNYESTPSVEDLGNLVARIQATGADIVKIATTALDITDCARVLQILADSQVPTIGLVMGDKGFISRILAAKFGGYLTFGTLEAGEGSASGQPMVTDLLELYNFRQIGPDTKVHGVIGNPIGHSKSPHLYNPAFSATGFDGIYLHLLVDNVPKFFSTYSCCDFVGYSFSFPYKEVGFNCSDEVDPITKSIGAINCMIRRPTGKLTGYNVDYLGAIAAIEEGLRASGSPSNGSCSPLAGKLFVVMGAGGAGKALAYGGYEKGARVVVANRTYERAEKVADKFGGLAISLSDLENFHPEEGMVLANTTSVGMKPKADTSPISKEALKNYSLVFDAVYTPKWTKLLTEAKESGAAVVFGTEMLLNQAFLQFEKFTGLPAPKELMRQSLIKNAS